MGIKLNIENFIKNNANLINENDWDEVYKLVNYNSIEYNDVGEFTKIILSCGVDPLPYMERVPSAYFYNVEEPSLDIYIPENVKYINQIAFYNCSIKSLHIPKSIIDIDTGGFALPRHVPIYVPYNDFEEFAGNVNMQVIDWSEYILISSITENRIQPIPIMHTSTPYRLQDQRVTAKYMEDALKKAFNSYIDTKYDEINKSLREMEEKILKQWE